MTGDSLSSAALMMSNGFVAGLTAVAALAIRVIVIPKEGAALTDAFGVRYTDYRARTGALLSRFGGRLAGRGT